MVKVISFLLIKAVSKPLVVPAEVAVVTVAVAVEIAVAVDVVKATAVADAEANAVVAADNVPTVPVLPRLKVKKKSPLLKVKSVVEAAVETAAEIAEAQAPDTRARLAKVITHLTARTVLARLTAVTVREVTPRELGAMRRRPRTPSKVKRRKKSRSVTASLVNLANVVNLVSVENASLVNASSKRRRPKSPPSKKRKSASPSMTTSHNNRLSPLVSLCPARPVTSRRPT
jgi:hypothetical protein